MRNKFSNNIPLIFAFGFLDTLKFYNAIAIILFSTIAGDYTYGMAVFSIIAITTVISELPTGILSDRIGRKKTIILGAFCTLLGTVFFALSNGFGLLSVGAVLTGIANAFYSGNNSAILFETLKAQGKLDEHQKILGKLHCMGYLARAAGGLGCAIILMYSTDMRILLWLTVIPQIIALILSFFIKEPNFAKKHQTTIFEHLKYATSLFKKNKKMQILTIAFVGDCSFGYASYEMMTAFLNTIIPTWAIALYKIALSVLGAIGAYISGIVIKIMGYMKGLVWGTFIVGGLRILAAFAGTILSPISFAIGQLFYSITDASQQHLLQVEYTDTERATLGSITSLLSGIAWSIVALLSGVLADATSPKTALITIITIWILRVLLFRKALRPPNKTTFHRPN